MIGMVLGVPPWPSTLTFGMAHGLAAGRVGPCQPESGSQALGLQSCFSPQSLPDLEDTQVKIHFTRFMEASKQSTFTVDDLYFQAGGHLSITVFVLSSSGQCGPKNQHSLEQASLGSLWELWSWECSPKQGSGVLAAPTKLFYQPSSWGASLSQKTISVTSAL